MVHCPAVPYSYKLFKSKARERERESTERALRDYRHLSIWHRIQFKEVGLCCSVLQAVQLQINWFVKKDSTRAKKGFKNRWVVWRCKLITAVSELHLSSYFLFGMKLSPSSPRPYNQFHCFFGGFFLQNICTQETFTTTVVPGLLRGLRSKTALDRRTTAKKRCDIISFTYIY